jgi:energy-coupling factor transporter ATP-binding protein EcfA2
MTEATEIVRTPVAAVPAPLLAVRNIEVVYDDVILVLRGLSLDVPQGAIVALLGANGAGKSTTLKAISGLLKTEDGEVTRGEIVFNGERINGIDPDKIVRRGIFQVMEGRRIISDMTSLENLRLGAFTRSDNEVGADIDMVFNYFPRLKERTGLADGAPEDDPDGRTVDGAVAAAGQGGVFDHQRDQPRPRRHHPAGGTKRARGTVGCEPRLHHGTGQGGARRQRG